MNRDEFLAWEQASRDTIDVKRCYIDIAGEDLVAGIMLSQIVYWHLPNKNGDERLRVEKDGVLWLAKGREDWWEECRISPKQFDRAARMLEDLGIIETDVKRFNGNPTKHLRLLWDTFLSLLAEYGRQERDRREGKNDIPQRVKTESPERLNQSRPKVKKEVCQAAISLTETSSETTKENTQRIAPAGASGGSLSLIDAEKERLGVNGLTVSDIVALCRQHGWPVVSAEMRVKIVEARGQGRDVRALEQNYREVAKRVKDGMGK